MLLTILISAIVTSSTFEVLVSSQDLNNLICQVSLQHNGKHLGVGTIIKPDFVIAPWSILQSKPQSEIKIVTKDSDNASFTYPVKSIRTHFEYDSSNAGSPNHNLALIHVGDGGFDFKKQPYLTNVSVPEQGYQPPRNMPLTLFGFDDNLVPVEQYVTVADRQKCKKIYENVGRVNDGDMCARVSLGSLCAPDLGSALVDQDSGDVVGIASWVDENCKNETLPGIFTAVGAYRYWIDSWIEEMLKQEQRASEIATKGILGRIADWVGNNNQESLCRVVSYDNVGLGSGEVEWIHQIDCKVACIEAKAGKGNCETFNTCMCDNGSDKRFYYDIKIGQ